MAELKVTHGGTKEPLYRVWAAMKDRCYNPNDKHFQDYGGRGIKVCDQWINDFSCFRKDVGSPPGPGFSLDRRDNDGPYSPENIRWATAAEQAANRRGSRLLTFKGKTQTMSAWAEELGIPYSRIKTRLNREHLTVEEALTRPSRYK